MKRNKRVRRVVVSADGQGVVSHAGVGLLREMAEYTGLVEGVTDALIGTYKGIPVHPPGRVFTDLAVNEQDARDDLKPPLGWAGQHVSGTITATLTTRPTPGSCHLSPGRSRPRHGAAHCSSCLDAVAKLAWSVPRRAVADRALR